MRCQKENTHWHKAQADGVHVLLTLFVIVLFIALGFVSYMLFKGKDTQNSIYQNGSKPIVQNPMYQSHFGCLNVKVDEQFERTLNDNTANQTDH